MIKPCTEKPCARCAMIEDLREAIHEPQDRDEAARWLGALMGAAFATASDQARFIRIFEEVLRATVYEIVAAHEEAAKPDPRQTVAGTGSVN